MDKEFDKLIAKALKIGESNSKAIIEHLTDCAEARKENTATLKAIKTQLDNQDDTLEGLRMVQGVGRFSWSMFRRSLQFIVPLAGLWQAVSEGIHYFFAHWHN